MFETFKQFVEQFKEYFGIIYVLVMYTVFSKTTGLLKTPNLFVCLCVCVCLCVRVHVFQIAEARDLDLLPDCKVPNFYGSTGKRSVASLAQRRSV